MKRSVDRILTTHVGSLPRPDELMALYAANASDDTLQPRLRAAVGDIVRQQAESGIDIVNDGEYGKAMRSSMDFGAWWSYVYPRLEGFELRGSRPRRAVLPGHSEARNARISQSFTPPRQARPRARPGRAVRAPRSSTASTAQVL